MVLSMQKCIAVFTEICYSTFEIQKTTNKEDNIMYHYVYLLEFPDKMLYVGAHSCKFSPQLDSCYLGSGRHLPKNRNRFNCKKTIIGEYLTRKEAMDAELAYIIKHDCVTSKAYYNARLRTFDRHGVTKETCPGAATSSRIQKGVTKHDSAAIRKRGQNFKQYVGKNRTPALLDADRRRGETIRGTKNLAKGHPGTANPAFTPWYYITPAGDYHEVYSTTRKDFAPQLGLTPRQIEHRFHHTNIHKPGKTKPAKGFTFGTLPVPVNTDTV